MEQIRSFIAIELPEAVKSALAGLQSRLKSGGNYSVKWVDPLSMHLTLQFLGNITPDKLKGITEVMEKAAKGISPFYLEVKELGVFPDLKRVRGIWVGLSGDLDKLKELQQHIESNLVPLGFTPENRAFAPHLTLARVRDQASLEERQNLGQLIANTKFESADRFLVNSVNLIKSQLTREGPIYSQISAVKLLG